MNMSKESAAVGQREAGGELSPPPRFAGEVGPERVEDIGHLSRERERSGR